VSDTSLALEAGGKRREGGDLLRGHRRLALSLREESTKLLGYTVNKTRSKLQGYPDAATFFPIEMTLAATRHLLSVATTSSILCSIGSAFTFVHGPRCSRAISPAFTKSSMEPQCVTRNDIPYRSLMLYETGNGFVEADNIDAIQELFTKFCDKDGLMTKSALLAMPPFSEMLVSLTKGVL